MRAQKADWTETKRVQLRSLWFDRTLSIDEIAARIGVTSYMVSGEATRQHLPSRQKLRGKYLFASRKAKLAESKRREAGAQPAQPTPVGNRRTIPYLPSELAAMTDDELATAASHGLVLGSL